MSNGEPADIVRRHEAGVVVPPGDTHALAHAIRTLRADPGKASWLAKNARCAAVKYYDRSQIAASFIGYLEKLHALSAYPYETLAEVHSRARS